MRKKPLLDLIMFRMVVVFFENIHVGVAAVSPPDFVTIG